MQPIPEITQLELNLGVGGRGYFQIWPNCVQCNTRAYARSIQPNITTFLKREAYDYVVYNTTINFRTDLIVI